MLHFVQQLDSEPVCCLLLSSSCSLTFYRFSSEKRTLLKRPIITVCRKEHANRSLLCKSLSPRNYLFYLPVICINIVVMTNIIAACVMFRPLSEWMKWYINVLLNAELCQQNPLFAILCVCVCVCACVRACVEVRLRCFCMKTHPDLSLNFTKCC